MQRRRVLVVEDEPMINDAVADRLRAVRWGVWLPRFVLMSGVVALLRVAAINPDAWIAERSLDRCAAG